MGDGSGCLTPRPCTLSRPTASTSVADGGGIANPSGCSLQRVAAMFCRCCWRCGGRRWPGALRSVGSRTKLPRRSIRRSKSVRPARCRWRRSRFLREARTLPPRRSPPSQRCSGLRGVAAPSRAVYRRAVRRIHEHIAAGDTYQVNYTYRLRAPWAGDPLEHFAHSRAGATVALRRVPRHGTVCRLSASPELCFRLEGDLLTCRPMKGTAPRGLTLVEDRLHAAGLRASEKERAENVMIVDMVRNDLGRIARVGTVRVPRLLETERYPTLWQMTSTVCAETAAPLDEILLALFPSASITGAPKVRTMQIIAGIERTPRGIYTGCVGVLGPGRRGWMNVAIRTLVVDRRRNSPSTAPAAGSSGMRRRAPSTTSAGPRRWCSAGCRRRSGSSRRWPGRRKRACCCSSGTCGASPIQRSTSGSSATPARSALSLAAATRRFSPPAARAAAARRARRDRCRPSRPSVCAR